MPQKLKTKTIIFRVNDEDYTRLLDAAGDMTLSAYMRAVLFDRSLKKVRTNRKPAKDQQALAQILSAVMRSNMPSNLNQIAKAVNCGLVAMPDEAIETLNHVLEELRDIRKMLLHALGKHS